MQSSWKEIYKKTAERTGKSEQDYKQIGNFVFHGLYTALRRPKNLIVKLKGVGFWYLRKRRVDYTLTRVPDPDKDDFKTELERTLYQNRIELYEILLERSKDYEKYIEVKKEIRKKRNETQVLLKPSNEE